MSSSSVCYCFFGVGCYQWFESPIDQFSINHNKHVAVQCRKHLLTCQFSDKTAVMLHKIWGEMMISCDLQCDSMLLRAEQSYLSWLLLGLEVNFKNPLTALSLSAWLLLTWRQRISHLWDACLSLPSPLHLFSYSHKFNLKNRKLYWLRQITESCYREASCWEQLLGCRINPCCLCKCTPFWKVLQKYDVI